MALNPHRFFRQLLVVGLALAAATCTDNTGVDEDRSSSRFVTPTGLLTSNPPVVLVGAGDIGTCATNNDEATAALIDNIPGTVFALGDNAYEDGSAAEYTNCYAPTWGRHLARTKPVPGNHDYQTSGAAGYYGYFGAAAGASGKGYYSYDRGAWHIIALNNEIANGPSSAQMQWLRADLAANPNLCTLAYWHRPLYSSTPGSGTSTVINSVRPLWDTLYAYGVDLVLNAHRHTYERIAPVKPDGTPNSSTGIRAIIVGTGGFAHHTQNNIFPASEVRNANTHGVLKLTLYDDSYGWEFVPVAGQTFTDAGSSACHPPPALPVATALGFAQQPTSASAGAAISPAVKVEIRDQFGARVTGATNSVSLSIGNNPGGGTLSGTTTVAAVSGVATFPGLSINNPGTGYTLTASSSGLSGATSSGFNITGAAPVATALGFVQQPTNSGAGATITPAIEVEIRDQFGARLTGATNSVSLSIGNNPGGGTLSGTTTVAAVSGVATFPGLSINNPGTGYTLTASSSGLSGATSSGFNITATPPPSGEITHSLLTSGTDLANSKNYTTASISPAPNTLVTISVLTRSNGSTSPTVSGGGMSSWSQVATVEFDKVSSPIRRLSIFRAMSASPGSGPITFSYTSKANNVEWIVSQWSGVETSGANGAGAIGQAGSARADNVGGLSVSLAPFGSANNAALGAFGVNSRTAAITPGAGFTEIDEQPADEGGKGDLQAEWALNRAIIDATWSNLNGGALGVEIKAKAGP
jgi:hypothetical protein